MNKPDITIKGFRGFDYSDAVEVGEMTRRTLIREVMKSHEDGLFFADAMLASTGDTLVLLIKNKRTGQHEVYDLKVRAHYMEEGDFRTGKVIKADPDCEAKDYPDGVRVGVCTCDARAKHE